MKKILWLSQHKPLPSQKKKLENLFGEIMLLRDVNPFTNAKDIVQRYQAGGYDDLVVVAPLSVIERLCKMGLHPLWAEMEQIQNDGSAEVIVRGRFYRFVCFKRIKAVKLEFMEV